MDRLAPWQIVLIGVTLGVGLFVAGLALNLYWLEHRAPLEINVHIDTKGQP